MINYLTRILKVRRPFLYSLIFIIIMASYLGIIKKEVNYLKEKRVQINLLEQEIKSIEKRKKSLSTESLKKTNKNLENNQSKAEIGMQSQLVLEEAHNFAKKVGLEVLGFKTLDQEDLRDFKSRSYDYVFEGSYESFISWLKLMEQTSYFINIEKLHIAPVGLVDDDLTGKSYDQELIIIVSTNNIALNDYTWTSQMNTQSRNYPFYPSIVVKEEAQNNKIN